MYTTTGQVAEDPRCAEMLKTAAGSRGARAAAVYAGVFRSDFEGIAARWIGTGTEATRVFEQPYGYIALAVLIFLAERRMRVTGIAEAHGEDLIEAVLPRNFLSSEGQLVVRLRADEGKVVLAAAVKVPGQLYDWGRSKRTLAKLVETVDTHVVTFHQRDL